METVSPVIMELNTVVVIIGTTVTAVLAPRGARMDNCPYDCQP